MENLNVKGEVAQGAASPSRKKVLTIITEQDVLDWLRDVAALYDDEFIAGPTKPRTILRKVKNLFTPKEFLKAVTDKMQEKRNANQKSATV